MPAKKLSPGKCSSPVKRKLFFLRHEDKKVPDLPGFESYFASTLDTIETSRVKALLKTSL